ncbi:MAG: hypothetical protein AUG74_20955 [Bacteroidetes bacterium 13_1_20CM_4_60_6]|nr:MAG: hypothetical protein AUG74_20955 [Bacteroidetes bacterium 13_1_20CM_4_60_6]
MKTNKNMKMKTWPPLIRRQKKTWIGMLILAYTVPMTILTKEKQPGWAKIKPILFKGQGSICGLVSVIG